MSCLICGSIAFDTIATFDGLFGDHILPEQIHTLNISFTVPTMRREFGGCAGNIAYSLRLLGDEPVVMGTVGNDGTPYLERFAALGINHKHVRKIPEMLTAQAIITTDKNNNQISAFHPGALTLSHLNKVADAEDIHLCIIAPDNKQAMLEHARECATLNIPFVFDPGQMLITFSKEELLAQLELASYLTVNDYEAKVLESKTGLSVNQLANRVKALIVTQGAHGSTIMTEGHTHHIPAVTAKKPVDPTGCGDAFRAGLLFGITHHLDWLTTGRLANLIGSFKVECHGPQNHPFSIDTIAERFTQTFGYRF